MEAEALLKPLKDRFPEKNFRYSLQELGSSSFQGWISWVDRDDLFVVGREATSHYRGKVYTNEMDAMRAIFEIVYALFYIPDNLPRPGSLPKKEFCFV